MTMREAGGLGQLCCCLRNKYMDPPIVSVGGHEGQVCLPWLLPLLFLSPIQAGAAFLVLVGWRANVRSVPVRHIYTVSQSNSPIEPQH